MPEVNTVESATSSRKGFIPADAFVNLSLSVTLKDGSVVSVPCNGIPLRKGVQGSLMDVLISTLAAQPELSEQIASRFSVSVRSVQLADGSSGKKYKSQDLF